MALGKDGYGKHTSRRLPATTEGEFPSKEPRKFMAFLHWCLALFHYVISIIRLHVIDLYIINYFFLKFFLKLRPCIHTFCEINYEFRVTPSRSVNSENVECFPLNLYNRHPRPKSCSSFTARNNYSKLFTKEGRKERGRRSGGHELMQT